MGLSRNLLPSALIPHLVPSSAHNSSSLKSFITKVLVTCISGTMIPRPMCSLLSLCLPGLWEETQGVWVQDLTPSQTGHLPQGQIRDLSESQMPPLTGNGISLIERLCALNEITCISFVVHRTWELLNPNEFLLIILFYLFIHFPFLTLIFMFICINSLYHNTLWSLLELCLVCNHQCRQILDSQVI